MTKEHAPVILEIKVEVKTKTGKRKATRSMGRAALGALDLLKRLRVGGVAGRNLQDAGKKAADVLASRGGERGEMGKN